MDVSVLELVFKVKLHLFGFLGRIVFFYSLLFEPWNDGTLDEVMCLAGFWFRIIAEVVLLDWKGEFVCMLLFLGREMEGWDIGWAGLGWDGRVDVDVDVDVDVGRCI